MKKIKDNRFLIYLVCLACLVLCLSIFYGAYNIKPSKTEAYSSTSIENYDDYIDYYKANSSEPVNRGVVAFYQAIESNIEELKSGRFEISMREEGLYDQISSLSSNDLYRAWAGAANAILYDDPENFFIEFRAITIKTTQSSRSKDVTLSSSNCYIDGIYNESQLNSMLTELQESKDKIYTTMYNELGQNPTDYQIVYFVNDYLVDTVTYDQTLSKNFVHTAYGSLVNGLAVCDGYSYGAQYLLDGLGITNLVVSGDAYNPSTGASEGHMWSYVKLYDHWYGLDVTWNDPIYSGKPSESLYEQNKVKYFLVGWNEETQSGFYKMPGDRDERVVSNYQIYFSFSNGSTLYLELPCPTIETSSYQDPALEVNQKREINVSDETTKVTITLDGQNMLDNMFIAYKYSSDGITFKDYVKIDDNLIFDNASYNGIYKFYIITEDNKIVKEGEQITVSIGKKYSLTVNMPEGVKYSLSPNKDAYAENEYVELSITNLPIGMEVASIASEQVEIEKLSENVYAFNFASADIELSISLQQKLYTITVGQLEGLSYQLSANEAYYNDGVTLTITSLPIGKNLVGLSGVEYQGELVVGEPISFTMPAENVEIGVMLEDIVYSIALNNNSGYEITCQNNAIYQEEVRVKAINLHCDQKIVISGVNEVEYIANNEVIFTMPADNIELSITTQEIEKHAINVSQTTGVEIEVEQSKGYFGQEIFTNLTYDFEQYRIISVRVNGIEAEKINDFQYSFIMQDEDVMVEVEIYEIPSLTITNDLPYQLEFNQDEDEFYYLVTLQSLPEQEYVRSVTAVDENGKIVFVVTRLSDILFRVDVEESDITLTFNFSDKPLTPDDGNDIDFLAIFLIFVGVVAFIALIYFLVKKSKRTL